MKSKTCKNISNRQNSVYSVKNSRSDPPRTNLGSLMRTLLLTNKLPKAARDFTYMKPVCATDLVHQGPKNLVHVVDTSRTVLYTKKIYKLCGNSSETRIFFPTKILKFEVKFDFTQKSN